MVPESLTSMIASLLGASDRRDESTSRVMRGRVPMLMLGMANANLEIKETQTRDANIRK